MFQLRIDQTERRHLGDIREDKVTYTGIVGELNERRADLSACEITVSYVRTTGADFSYPYYFDSCSFATLAPKELSRAFVVLQPFKVETWTAFAVSAAAIFGLVAVMDRITEKFILVFICSSEDDDERTLGPETSNTTGARRDPFGRVVSSGRPTKFIPTFKEFLFASLSAAKNRAIDLVLEQFTPRRIALCFFFLTMVVISALYSGTLTAFMAFPGFSPTLNDLNDLLKACLKGDIVWGTLRGTSQLTLFRTATSGVYKDLYDVTLKAGLDKTMVGSPVQGVQTVLYGNYVYIHPTVTLMFYAAKLGGETTFHISRDSFYANFYGIGFQQGSPIKPKMDQMVFRILSSGVIYKWRKELIDEQLAEAPKDLRGDPKEIEDERRAFSLNDMQSAFYVLFIGYGLCFLAFGLEVFLHDSKWKETNE